MADIRRDTEAARLAESKTTANANANATSSPETKRGVGLGNAKTNGTVANGAVTNGVVNGAGMGTGKGQADKVNARTNLPLAVPKVVIDEGVRVTRECLELVCEIED